MKFHFLILFSFLHLFTNCSKNEIQEVESIVISWHLIQTKKNTAGTIVEYDFNLNTIIWVFDNIKKTLTVENKNTDDSKRDLLDSGTYNFSISNINGQDYFFIDAFERGLLTINKETRQLIIDENKKTTGEVTNKFIYTFQNVIVITE